MVHDKLKERMKERKKQRLPGLLRSGTLPPLPGLPAIPALPSFPGLADRTRDEPGSSSASTGHSEHDTSRPLPDHTRDNAEPSFKPKGLSRYDTLPALPGSGSSPGFGGLSRYDTLPPLPNYTQNDAAFNYDSKSPKKYDTVPALPAFPDRAPPPVPSSSNALSKSQSADFRPNGSSESQKHFSGNRTQSFSPAASSIESFEAKVPVRRWTGTGREFQRAGEKPALCQICHNLKLDHEIFIDEARVVRLNLFDLAESAFEGDCRWCALVYRSMAELGASLPSPDSTGFVRIMAKPGEPFLVEWVTDSRLTAEIYRASDDREIRELGDAPNVAADISKTSVFQSIRSWLKTCEKDHAACSQDDTVAPRRLLDIGTASEWKDHRPIKMRLQQDLNKAVKYVAFSHRWGLERHFTTTNATLAERMEDIAWSDLPVSYQDCITVAHELDVRYIWIDSLCIVQDNFDDWEDQSKKLADIFELSWLTIAAALSPGDDTGFLRSSPEREEFLGQIIDLSDFGIRNGTVRARTIHDFRTVKTAHTLETRAWTLQETLFPPRLLTFSVLVYLECRTTSFCECGHDLFPDPFCGKVMSFDRVDRRLFNDMLRRPTKAEALEYWHKTIIPDYSRRQLTNFKDRLPAVSALALRFEAKLNDQYLAGIWRDNIPLHLAWSVQKMGIAVPERAPSWSWASVEGPMEWLSWYFVTNSATVSDKVRLMSVDATVGPKIDTLVVRGKMCSVWLELTLVDMFAYSVKLNREDKGELAFALDPDKSPYMLDTPLTEVVTPWGDEATIQRHAGKAVPSTAEMFCPVRCLLLFQADNEQHSRRIFLILTPSPRNPGAFRRIGVFSLERHKLETEAHPWYFNEDGLTEETIRLE